MQSFADRALNFDSQSADWWEQTDSLLISDKKILMKSISFDWTHAMQTNKSNEFKQTNSFSLKSKNKIIHLNYVSRIYSIQPFYFWFTTFQSIVDRTFSYFDSRLVTQTEGKNPIKFIRFKYIQLIINEFNR